MAFGVQDVMFKGLEFRIGARKLDHPQHFSCSPSDTSQGTPALFTLGFGVYDFTFRVLVFGVKVLVDKCCVVHHEHWGYCRILFINSIGN